MARNIDIELLRKRYQTETGGGASFEEVDAHRYKSDWYISPSGWVKNYLVANGVLHIPDLDYVEWLENELINKK